jgi:hypothetical protein
MAAETNSNPYADSWQQKQTVIHMLAHGSRNKQLSTCWLMAAAAAASSNPHALMRYKPY